MAKNNQTRIIVFFKKKLSLPEWSASGLETTSPEDLLDTGISNFDFDTLFVELFGIELSNFGFSEWVLAVDKASVSSSSM